MSSVENALMLLQFIAAEEEVRVSEAASHLGVAPSTGYRLLSALRTRGFVEQERANGTYKPGPALTTLSWTMVARSPGQSPATLREEARSILDDLRDSTNETVSLVLLEGRTARFVECAESRANVRVGDRNGLTLDAHTSSVGKALLAELPLESLEQRYPAHHLPSRTSRSISSWPALLRELETVRNRGCAINSQESTDDVCAVGVAIGEPPLCPFSGLAIAIPASRANDEYIRSLLPALADARDRLRERLK